MNKFASLVTEWVGRPSLDTLGDTVHTLWFARLPPLDRRELLRRIANDLLWHVGDERRLGDDCYVVEERLLDDVRWLVAHPENVERKLLGDALYAALSLVMTKDDLSTAHAVGGRVYAPLLKLQGLRLATVANASKPRKLTVSYGQLERHRLRYRVTHGGSDYGWQKAAAAEFAVSAKTIARHFHGERRKKKGT